MTGKHLHQWVIILCFLLTSCKTTDTTDINSTATLPVIEFPAESFITLGPTAILTLPPTFWTTLSQPSFCYNGPSQSYIGAVPISVGTDVEILGRNSDGGDWFMIRNINIAPCWVEKNTLNLSPNIPLERIHVFTTIITFEETPCYVYPNSERQTVIPKNRRVVVYGKSNPNAEWILIVPHNMTRLCWIANNYSTDLSSVPFEVPDFVEPTATGRPFIPEPTNTNRSGDDNNDPPPPPTTPPPPPTTPPPPTNTPPPPTNTPPPPTNTSIPPTPTLCWPPGHCR